MFKNIYSIGELVYHRLPDSPRGIIVDWRYIASSKTYEYQVAFEVFSPSLWYCEHELSPTKVY